MLKFVVLSVLALSVCAQQSFSGGSVKYGGTFGTGTLRTGGSSYAAGYSAGSGSSKFGYGAGYGSGFSKSGSYGTKLLLLSQPAAVASYAQPASYATYAQPASFATYAQPASYATYAQPAATVALVAQPAYTSGATFLTQQAGSQRQEVVKAAVQQVGRTVEYKNVPYQEQPIEAQVVEVEPSDNPLHLHFKSRSSSVSLSQSHTPAAPQETQVTSSRDEPSRLVHEVEKPVIQEVREVITPYRQVTQEVQPVVESVHTVVSKAEGERAQYTGSNYAAKYSEQSGARFTAAATPVVAVQYAAAAPVAATTQYTAQYTAAAPVVASAQYAAPVVASAQYATPVVASAQYATPVVASTQYAAPLYTSAYTTQYSKPATTFVATVANPTETKYATFKTEERSY